VKTGWIASELLRRELARPTRRDLTHGCCNCRPKYLLRPAQCQRGGESPELIVCVKRSVQHLLTDGTHARRLGILPGKIQSGTTRGILGIMAHGLDKGFRYRKLVSICTEC
jgi:hypothetical protein